MFKKFDRLVTQSNPNGTFLTKLGCASSGENIPSIADYQLIHEFIDFNYLKYGELDHIKWRETYPRLVKWHDAMLVDDSPHAVKYTSGLRAVIEEWKIALPGMVKKQYCEDR